MGSCLLIVPIASPSLQGQQKGLGSEDYFLIKWKTRKLETMKDSFWGFNLLGKLSKSRNT